MGDITLREALREAEDSLAQARAEVWGAFDELVDADPQTAVDDLIAGLDRRVGPLVEAVMRLGGDPRRCWPRGSDPGRRGGMRRPGSAGPA